MEILEQIDAFVWGPAMIVLLLGSHIFLTFRTRFIQWKIPQAIKMSLKRPEGEGRYFPFGALLQRSRQPLAPARRGRGYGDLGGWSWRYLLDVAYGCVRHRYEVFLGVRRDQVSREGSQWQHAGRRHVCLAAWVHEEWQGALVCARGCGRIRSLCGDSGDRHGIGSAGIGDDGHHDVERSSGRAVDHRHAIVVLVAAVIFGGVKIISDVCERLVPVMAIGYALGCVIILALNWAYLWDALVLIFECAFTAKAAFGGAVGSGIMVALQFGCARGLFSNESGLGSAPIIAAAAKTKNPAEQSLIAMTGTFWSTVVICALTGIVLVSTMLAHPGIQDGIGTTRPSSSGAQLASLAFARIPLSGHAALGGGHGCVLVLDHSGVVLLMAAAPSPICSASMHLALS